LQRSYGFPGWCAICRWTAVGAISVGTMAVLGAATSDHRPAPTVVRLAAQPEGTGLDWPGWTVRDPAEQRRSLDLLLNREKDRRTAATKAATTSIVSRTASAAPASPSAVAIPQSALGQGATLAAPQAVSVAIRFALAQVGKPYVWGATGPDSYDCSGLVQRSYAMAGVALPRTSRELARVGKAVDLPDLLPGDLLFWAYDPSDLSTVHHVAMYLGDGKIVQAPQPGEFVEVTTMWLSGYAGAVRVATGPATAALPPVPVGVPGTGITPVGDAMPDGSPPPSPSPPMDSPPRTQQRSAASSQSGAASGTTTGTTSPDGTPRSSAPGSTSPDGTAPGTTSPGTTSPGTTSPGSSSPGSSSPGTTSPGTTSPGSTSPGTTSSGSSASGDSSSPTGSHQPSGSASGSGTPATSSAAPDPTTPAPTSSAPSSTPPPAPTTPAPPSPTPPPPAPSPSGDASSDSAAPATTTSAPPKPSVSPSSPTPSPT
jgi:cell wall-associated NlpC family hydrolase